MRNLFFLLGRYQKPVYTGVDSSASKYVRYDFQNNTHVFIVEQGTRFYLKLNLSANPWPTSCNLSKNGVVLQRSPLGTIQLEVDSVNIQSVQASDAANYTISCSNTYGQGNFSFRLNVVGKGNFVFSQTILPCNIFSFPLQLQMHITSHAPLTSGTSTTTHRAKLKLLLLELPYFCCYSIAYNI